MRGANIFAGAVGALWAALAWLGLGLVKGVSGQHVAGYPNSAQVFYYVDVPLLIVVGLLVLGIILNRVRWSPTILAAASAAAMLFLVPYMFAYTGGV